MFNKNLIRLLLGMSMFGVSSCAIYTNGATQAYVAQESRARIAVLDFEQEGVLAGEKLGGFAADELTAALFAQKKFAVVDRAQVQAAVHTLQLSVAIISAVEIKKLGESLQADYLALGKLQCLRRADFDSAQEKSARVQISFRLLAARNGEVLGVFAQRGNCKGQPAEFISNALHEMAGAVKFK